MHKKLLSQLSQQLLQIKTEAQMQDFLSGLFTPAELMEIPTRLEIVRLLKQGVAQHEIARQLGVGVATVTRGAKEIQKGRFQNV